MEKVSSATDWIVWVFIFCTLVLGIARFFYSQRFRTFLTDPGSNTYLEQHLNLSERGKDAFTVLMELVFYPSIAFLIVLFIKAYNQNDLGPDDWILWVEITLAVAFFFVINNLLISLFAYLFDILPSFSAYSFQKMTYRQWAILFPSCLAFIAVFAESAYLPLLFISGALFVGLYIYGLIKSMAKHFSSINLNMIHFILYLCALEIAPLLIVIKWI